MELNLLFRRLDRIPVDQLNTSEKLADFLKNLDDPEILDQISYFGREMKLLAENGYVYDQTSKLLLK